ISLQLAREFAALDAPGDRRLLDHDGLKLGDRFDSGLPEQLVEVSLVEEVAVRMALEDLSERFERHLHLFGSVLGDERRRHEERGEKNRLLHDAPHEPDLSDSSNPIPSPPRPSPGAPPLGAAGGATGRPTETRASASAA